MSNAQAMERALTEVVSRGDFTVPPYPAVALRLQRLLAREGYGVGEVADVIAADAPLAAGVLAAANSALLGSAGAITSLSRAVNRLGARTVGSIAVASSVGAVALSNGVLFDVKFRVWRRGIACALTCQKLAPGRGLDSEEAFLAGLLHGFGRSIAVASLEQLLKTHQPARALTAAEWLNIAEQQRAPLAAAVAKSWQLPPVVAEAIQSTTGSPLNKLVIEADDIAGELDAGRLPHASRPGEEKLLDEVIAGLPAALDAYAPPPPAPTVRPSAALAKPERVLDGELRRHEVRVTDRRAKAPATLLCRGLTLNGIELDSSRAFQESSVVRLALGDPDAHFEPWLTVVLCVPSGSRYRVELQLFSPSRETREQWRVLYDGSAPRAAS
jgi:HD-like signal output (HDOD) protein